MGLRASSSSSNQPNDLPERSFVFVDDHELDVLWFSSFCTACVQDSVFVLTCAVRKLSLFSTVGSLLSFFCLNLNAREDLRYRIILNNYK